MNRQAPSPQPVGNTSLLVVHGVGVEHSGVSMLELAESLVAHERLPVPLALEHFALEGGPLGGYTNKMAVFLAPTLTIPGRGERLRLVELYWGDLAGLGKSLAGAILAAFRLILGLRFLLIPLRREPGIGVLPWLCNLVFLLIRGPILGGSIFAIALALLGSMLWAVLPSLEQVSWTLLAGCSLIVGLALLVLRRLSSRTSVVRSWTAGWFLFACLIAAVGLGIGAWRGGTGIGAASLIVIHVLRQLWSVTNILSLSCLITTIFLCLRAPRSRPSLLACFAATQLSLGFWAVVVPAVILATDAFVPESAKFEGWDQVMREALPTIGITWSGFLALLLAALGIWLSRLLWSKKKAGGLSQSSADRPPRLILGSAVAATFLLAPIWILYAFLAIVRGVVPGGAFVAMLNGMAIVAAPAVLALLAAGLPVIRILLAIALDTVNYFKPDAGEARKLWPSAEQKGPLRQEVNRRFRGIVEQLLSEQGAGSRLVVLAHSQGTMLAIDCLREPDNQELLGRFSSVHLLTMGSPYTHLYQTYFPTELKMQERASPQACVASWTNFYRFDDYVGTDVDEGTRLGTAAPQNIGLGLGGHTGYFSDRRVIAELAGLVLPRGSWHSQS